jgi:hypothetical protein
MHFYEKELFHMKSQISSKLKAYSVAAGAATLGIATVAQGLTIGEIGSGVHVQFGPQDINGTYLGVRAEGPSWSAGYTSIALNPYTGEVTTDLDLNQMYDNYKLTGPSGLPDDPETPDVDESILSSAWVDTMPASTMQDSLYFTTEIVDHSGKDSHSFFGNTSADGGLMPVKMGVGQEIDLNAMVTRDEMYYYDDWFAVGGTWAWGGRGYVGFQMDGIAGWAEIGISNERTGLWLREFYFDFSGGGVEGDFDGDGDIDADDIDILMANLGGDPGEFDLTDDGVVDQDDVDEWVFNIVPIGENIGTVYGDFNLDGEVNAGDLALLATNYGLVGTWGWATGDGNGDGNVDAGDLAMLATNYGTVVHPVPEPVTLSLLAVGGAALLRRRSR